MTEKQKLKLLKTLMELIEDNKENQDVSDILYTFLGALSTCSENKLAQVSRMFTKGYLMPLIMKRINLEINN
jgi:hypothetical protein